VSTTSTSTPTGTPASGAAPRRQRSDAQRNRERVLDAARAAFAEHGTGASLEDVARRAGVGIGTVYRHFPSRQDLLVAVFRDNVDTLHAHAADLLVADDPFAALGEWLRTQLQHAAKYQALTATVMIGLLNEGDDAAPSCEELRSDGAAIVRRAQAAGVVRPDVDADDVLRLVNAIALATEEAPDGPALASRLLGVVLDGLRPRPPGC
jgi:AcrR family transcriptional regulator